MREIILLIFLKKELFRIKIMHLKQKKKNQNQKKNQKKIKDCYNKFSEYIENESKGINYELFEKHFNFVTPTALAKTLYEIKNKKRNIELVNVIKSRLIDLKYEIEKMSEDEKKP